MAVFPGTEPILEAATEWKDRCLLSDGSALVPGRQTWTARHFEELHEHFVENERLGKEHFLEKLEDQLDGASDGAKQLAAEILWVMMLFPKNFNKDTKIRKVRTVWEWSGEPLPDSPLLDAPFDEWIGSVGPGFINHQPFELKYFIEQVRELKSRPPEERRALLEDPWELSAWLDSRTDLGLRQLRHMLAHLLLPESFERIASARHKRMILQAFGRPPEPDAPLPEIDKALLDLRKQLEVEYPDRPNLDFYRPPLNERWQLHDLPQLEFIDEKMERARGAFLEAFPDFQTFEDPGEDYIRKERGYKDVLRERFREIVEALPAVEELTEESAARIVEDVNALVTQKLEPYDWVQNLIGWRYTGFLKKLDAGERMVFARALIELLDEEVASPARAQRFVQDVWPVLESHDAAGYAMSRSLPSFFLALADPEHEIFIRTDLFNSLAKELTGEKLFLNKRLDMAEYQKALAMGVAVRSELEKWKWKPRDMIDVQSFMWVARQMLEDGYEERSPTGGAEDRPPRVADSHQTYSSGRSRDLDEIMEDLEADGLHFPRELVANYVLALQTKRFVILTGISGTGKTQLAMRVGQFFSAAQEGSAASASNTDAVEVVAVRPDWTDHRGLLGYHNPITDAYVATPFLRHLLAAKQEEEQAQKENRPARPFFAILDEMNLARVEHYFSDFLSVLESGGELHLHEAGPQNHAEGREGAVPRSLKIPRNVFFTGTVNVDETTHMFSPKVLDRAFTLELSEVDLDGWAVGDIERPGMDRRLYLPALDADLQWRGHPGSSEWIAFGDLLEGKLREVVTGLNRALEPWGYHFGYRVAGEIAAFVMLARQQGASDPMLWAALDLALLQKVLPKFHGTEQELEPPLRAVAFVAHHGRAPTDGERERAQDEAQHDEQDARLPRCADKVERMLGRLRVRGFAAFIE